MKPAPRPIRALPVSPSDPSATLDRATHTAHYHVARILLVDRSARVVDHLVAPDVSRRVARLLRAAHRSSQGVDA